MEIKKGDRGWLRASEKGLLMAVNGLNHGNECIVIESLEDDCLVVRDLDQVLVSQESVARLGYPRGQGFLLIHVSQFEAVE